MSKSFTLIEILVVIVIIGILSGFIIVSMAGVSSKARIAKSQAFTNSLRNSLLMNLIAEWNFDACAGASATADCIIDTWGINGYNGGAGRVTINGTAPTVSTASSCVRNNCLNFDGSNAITINQFTVGKNMTISLWLKSAYDDMMPFTLDSDTLWDLDIYFCGGSNLIMWDMDGDCYNDFGDSVHWPDSGWHSFVMVNNYNNGTDSSTKLYLDGTYAGTAHNYYDSTATNKHFMIGNSYSFFPWNGFIGSVDEIHVYDAAMSTSQIEQNYYAGLNQLLLNGGISSGGYRKGLGELKSNLTNEKL
ncbi:MAG: prepilin-type N-terminal cleavage/methylation domain-containing protein [Candidatus Pacebacteria bacterium]|nr:prepilin-type N-terminal cleavage/methylation domain-containing protein [Candidatus Paceibacterota bacterium]